MGINEFGRWCEITASQGQPAASPGSWAGSETDPFWQEAHRRRR